MAQRTIQQGQVPASTKSLRSGPITCPAGQETTLVSTVTRFGLFPYIVSRAFFVNGVPTDVHFRTYRGGAPIGDETEFERNTQLGTIGNPQPEEPKGCMGGQEVKITFINNDSDPYTVESDGRIEEYRERLR